MTMERDVIRLYSSSPPPLDEAGEEEEEDEFGEFGGFDSGGVSASFGFTDIDTSTTFNQSNALEDSPPDLNITFTQNVTASGKSGWGHERKILGESFSNVEILTNGVTSFDLHGTPSDEQSQNSSSILPDIRISSTDDVHVLSNGYSESCVNSEIHRASSTCLQSTDTEVHSGSDISIDDVSNRNQLIDQTDNLPDLSNHSSHKEASELEETEGISEECANVQSFNSCGDAQEAEGEQELRGNVVLCYDEGCLGTSTDMAEAEGVSSTDVSRISDMQLSGETREIHGSNIEVKVDEDIEMTADTTANEDFGDFRDATQGFADFSRTESITQEGFPEFVTAMSRCSTDDEFGDTDTLKDFTEEDNLAEEAFCSELPPSDSFADFSSVPFRADAVDEEDNWAAFGPHEGKIEDQDSWATFGTEQSEEQNVVTSFDPSSDDLQDSTAELGCKLQNLFTISFSCDDHPEVSGVTEVLPLHKVLQDQDPQEQNDLSSSFAQKTLDMWRHLQDIHGSHGLKFKWAGSHSNKVLLSCLGIRNILFTGDTKQPVIVPMFAAGLGMLEPTKESQKSPASHALSFSAPVESGNTLCTQVAPSLAISIDGFSCEAQDGGISKLNLDYFGPVDECSSDSESDTPLPGVDPEIYELTTAKIENDSTGRSIADAFTKLMESVEKTRTVTRKTERDEKISEEAAKVISLLPDLSFMQAKVLMFPSILTPAANHICANIEN